MIFLCHCVGCVYTYDIIIIIWKSSISWNKKAEKVKSIAIHFHFYYDEFFFESSMSTIQKNQVNSTILQYIIRKMTINLLCV